MAQKADMSNLRTGAKAHVKALALFSDTGLPQENTSGTMAA
jgi:hypothetical protein